MHELRRYRAYFLSASDHIREVLGFKAIDDMSACLEADLMLSQRDYAAVEIYEDWRMVWRKETAQRAA